MIVVVISTAYRIGVNPKGLPGVIWGQVMFCIAGAPHKYSNWATQTTT